jgi:hypothetical protein
MDAVALGLFLGLVALFAVRAWMPHGRLSGRDRSGLIAGFAVAAAAFVAASRLINWVVVPTGLWLVGVALLAAGVAGAARRWPELAWFAGTRTVGRAVRGGAILVICALVVGAAVA